MKTKQGVKTIIYFLLLVFVISCFYLFSQNQNNNNNEPPKQTSASTEESDYIKAQVTNSRNWIIKDNTLDNNFRESVFRVSIESNISPEDIKLFYQINDKELSEEIPVSEQMEAEFIIREENLIPGEYNISVIAITTENETTLKTIPIHVSYPIYVAWTIDWEGLNVSIDTMNEAITQMETISNNYNLPITHMYNPEYLLPSFNQTKSSTYTNWVRDRYNYGNDDIGMHLHMYWELVESAGVEPILEPSYYTEPSDGYAVASALYTYDDYKKIVEYSMTLFEQNDLPKPTSFRAGGWMADLHNVKAVQDAGIMIDSSGKIKSNTGKLFADNWDIDPRCGPFHPSHKDKNNCNLNNDSRISIMEIPNNGGDSYRYTVEEMNARFDMNFENKAPLTIPKSVVYLSHPEYGPTTEFPKITETLGYISNYRIVDDNGPVVFVTLTEIKNSWEQNNWTNTKYY